MRFILILALLSGVIIACTSNTGNQKEETANPGASSNQPQKPSKEILAAGEKVFTNTCQLCHNDTNKLGAPSLGIMGSMAPRSILAALRTGKMKVNAEKLSLEECEAVTQWVTKKLIKETSIPAEAFTEFKLPPNSEINQWISGWGGNPESTGFTTAADAGITPANVQTLQLKWAFAFPDVDQARCRPAIVGDWLITGTDIGDVFAINKKTGLIGWRFKTEANIRGGIQLYKSGDSIKVLFADFSTNVYALDLRTGKLIWKKRVGPDSQSSESGSVAVYDNMVYIPVSSFEVVSAMNPGYNCCSTSGGVVALNAGNGEFVWQHRVITEPATLTGKSKNGKPVYTPSGAPVWCSPTVDAKRGQLLIGTGENYTMPATTTSDAVQALDLKTGKLIWNYQATANDTWNLACPGGPNCPDANGPDLDFGMAPILVKGKDGNDMLVIGQKSAVVHALDPGTGKLLWKKRIGKGGALGGVHMGMATDGKYVFAPNSDNIYALDSSDKAIVSSPGLYALDLQSGNVIWRTEIPACDTARKGCLVSNSAAPLALPGLVFAGGLDGRVRAYDAATGKVLWSFDAVHEFKTVNGVKGKGGAMDGSSPVASDGMLYVNAGYGMFGQIPGNMLLAFEVRKN
ncbi:MAG: PQQ-binding-like beta-propeller repeat protein [Chitinophagaceae bacterium]